MTHIFYPVLGKIRAHPRRITGKRGGRSINGIGGKTAEKVLALALSFSSYGLIKTYPKVIEIDKIMDLQRIKYERKEDVVAAQLFTNYGVGG